MDSFLVFPGTAKWGPNESDTEKFLVFHQKMKNELGMQLEISQFTQDISREMRNRLGTLLEVP